MFSAHVPIWGSAPTSAVYTNQCGRQYCHGKHHFEKPLQHTHSRIVCLRHRPDERLSTLIGFGMLIALFGATSKTANCLRVLVDLNGFELLTSSMPFKKYQSLTRIESGNERLRRNDFGRHWTPAGPFQSFGLRSDSRTPHLERHSACLRARLLAQS